MAAVDPRQVGAASPVVLDGGLAAWKALGKTLVDSGQPAAALAAYEQGISVAEARGDIQAAKEMTVFAKRIRKAQADPA